MSSHNPSISVSGSSVTDVESMIDNLAPELLEAMKKQHILIVGVKDLNRNISRAIYDAKKEELIKPLRTQLNFRVPNSLSNNQNENALTIKKDILFYKKAYEDEAANINKIINSTNKLNNQLLEPLIAIKGIIKDYYEDYKKNIENIISPYSNKKEGIDKIDMNIINNKEDVKKDFEQKVTEVNTEINSYQNQSINFFKILSNINQELSNDINSFINSFKELSNSVNDLKKELLNGFSVFENCTPEFEDLNNEETIKKAKLSIISPLERLMKLISETQVQGITYEPKNYKGLTPKMLEICEELKEKAKTISEKINQARLKLNLNELKHEPIKIEPPKIENIEKDIGDIKGKIEETNKKNNEIKEKVKSKIEDDINKTRLDILFIIDSTNSTSTHLESIKKNFNKMIKDICKTCPTATIFIGFIGYTDFSELDLDEKYIDIEFTDKKEEISEKIENLEPNGGGDEPEDLAGAFELALNKNWKGFSRFAILATDAPCHGMEFHSPDMKDNYPNGDRHNRDIKKFVREFAEKNISLFCVNIAEVTNQMFGIFKLEYEKGKKKDSSAQFTLQTCKDICETIIQKACEIYVNRNI